MKLLLGTLAIAVAVGFLLGGRLSRLADLRLRWAPLALSGFALQVITPPGSWPLVLLTVSFVLLSGFAVANREVPGFRLIMLGVFLNFLVIVANGGMPVSADALVASGQGATAADLTDNADRYVKHHLADAGDRLLFLGDVIPLPPPVSQAISVGDVCTYAGIGIVIVSTMRGRRRAPTGRVGGSLGEVAGVGR
jgi:hypothetical protein